MLMMVLFTTHKSVLDYQSNRDMTLVSHSDFKSLPSVFDENTFGQAHQHFCW